MSDALTYKIIGAALGSLGFGIMFHGSKKHTLLAIPSAMLSIVVYLVCLDHFDLGIFLSALIAGFVCDLYAEIMCRILKAPSTVFFLIGSIPLIPGGALYYCIDKIVVRDLVMAVQYGLEAFYTALGITVGMCIAWAICDLLRKIKKKMQDSK